MQARTGTGGRLARDAIALALALTSSGCSYVFMPSRARVEAHPDACVDHRVAPTIDTTFTVVGSSLALLGLFVLVAAGPGEQAGTGQAAGLAVAGVGTVIALPFGYSAAHGFRSARSCRAARSAPPGAATRP
ncbi:MAG: hypothetical protein IPH44_10200 [Myxococcales bacterium]|nr:hypothetical protein [Myxococcales bacterium]MBK7195852.1 hypothetical protein [Myxococcales bacterium]MBP6842560.1 hypothetical protein [Kofleriaceae bacterium]